MDPNKLHVFHNKDKDWHAAWTPKRNLCNIPHPFRAVLIGRPNCGKTSVAQNIFIRQEPPFEKLIIVHVDSEYSQEWDACDPSEIIDHIPDFKEIDGEEKTLIIFEDFEVNGLCKENRHKLSRLFGYCSTHKNVSLIVNQQDFSCVSPVIRRMCNLFVLWPGLDPQVLDVYARKIGLRKGLLANLFNQHTRIKHDSIWIDLTSGTPAPLRLNCFTPLEEGL